MSFKFIASDPYSTNVGIGISSIIGATGATGASYTGPTGPQGNPGTATNTGATGPTGPTLWQQGSNGIIYYNGGAVGIGTSNPDPQGISLKLDVQGSAGFHSSSNNGFYINLGSSGTYSTYRSAYMYMEDNTANRTWYFQNQMGTGWASSANNYGFCFNPNNGNYGSTYINGDGQMQIFARNNGDYVLRTYQYTGLGYGIRHDSYYSGNYLFQANGLDQFGNFTTALTVHSAGNGVVIGALGAEPDPRNKLSITPFVTGKTQDTYISIYNNLSGVNGAVYFGMSTGSVATIKTNSPNVPVEIRPNNTLGLYVSTGGKVGVQTNNPQAELDVSGQTNTNSLFIYGGTTGANSNAYMYNTTVPYQTSYVFTVPSTGPNQIQTFTTDANTTDVVIECYGAGGGLNAGNGGYSRSTMSGLTGPTTFKFWVGDLHEGGNTYNALTSAFYTGTPYTVIATGPVYNSVNSGNITSVDQLYGVNTFWLFSGPNVVGWGYGTINMNNTIWISQPYYYAVPSAWPEVATIPDRSNVGISNLYNNVNSFTGSIINWKTVGFLTQDQYSLTGTILYTASYVPNTWPEIHYLISGGTVYGVEIRLINQSAINQTFNAIYTGSATNLRGGGASFVYAQTGSQYSLCNVAGGGGANGFSVGQPIQYVQNFQGGNANSSSSDVNLLQLYANSNQIYTNIYNSTKASAGNNNNNGVSGQVIFLNQSTGVFVNATNGSGTMPLFTGTVNQNGSCQGGDGAISQYLLTSLTSSYRDSSRYRPIFGLTENCCGLVAFGGGGGRGYGGGGGGGIYTSSISQTRANIWSYIYTGTVAGGAGGGNYSYNGIMISNGYGTGSYTGTVSNSSPGIVKFTVTSKSQSSFIITSSSGPIKQISSTGSMTLQTNGSSLIPNNLTIGKQNTVQANTTNTALDVAGNSNLIGNVQITDYQKLFASSTFDPNLYAIFANNFAYPSNDNTVSINYSLAAMNLEIGYLQNALAGLASMLGYAFGTYNVDGNLIEVPYWVKQYLANYLPITSASLSNYISARLSSLNPPREYYLANNQILPFGAWAYNYIANVDGQYGGSFGKIGFYLEDGKYYVFSDKSDYLSNNVYSPITGVILRSYIINSVFSTNNLQLLNQLNNPSGAYRYNITRNVYSTLQSSYNIGLTDLVTYLYYTGSQDYINTYNPPQNFDTNPLEDRFVYIPTGGYNNFWNYNVFYDLFIFYTGTFTKGIFLNEWRPYQYTGFAIPYSTSFTEQKPISLTSQNEYELSEQEISYVKNFRAPTSTKTTTLASLSQNPGPIVLGSTNTTTTLRSIQNNKTTTVTSTQAKVGGTNNNSSTANVVQGRNL